MVEEYESQEYDDGDFSEIADFSLGATGGRLNPESGT